MASSVSEQEGVEAMLGLGLVAGAGGPADDPGEDEDDVPMIPGVMTIKGTQEDIVRRARACARGRLHGMDRDELERTIDELGETLGMSVEADRRTKGFSKGQTLKIALARALVHKPHNVILDEPTNGLDVASSRAVRDLVRRIRDEGRCVLFSSHIMSEVQALCDRIIVMGYGRIVAEGTPDDLATLTGQADLEEIFVAISKEEAEMKKRNQLEALKGEVGDVE